MAVSLLTPSAHALPADQNLEQYLIAGVVPQLKHLQASQDNEVQNLAYDIYIAYTRNRSRFNILSYSGYSVR